MADQKISQLTALTGANTAADDLLAIVDTNAAETKKITREEFFKNIQTNVGIGTGSPQRLLDIRSVSDGNIVSFVKLKNQSGVASTGGSLDFDFFGSDLNAVRLVGFRENASDFSSAMSFYTSGIASGTGVERMRITSAGNVGIGTSSPTQKLTVGGNIAVNAGFLVPYNGSTITGYIGYGTSLGSANDISIRCDTGNILFGFNGAERMRIDSSGNVLVGKSSATANGGDLQVSKGITFPATQSAQSDANTLDDYEEGTWTPVVADAETGGNTAFSVNAQGRYTKVGNFVTLTFNITDINKTGMTAGNSVWIRGLPFVNNASYPGNGVVDIRQTTFTVYPTLNIGTSSSAFRFFEHISGSGVSTTLVSNLSATTSAFFGAVTYFV